MKTLITIIVLALSVSAHGHPHDAHRHAPDWWRYSGGRSENLCARCGFFECPYYQWTSGTSRVFSGRVFGGYSSWIQPPEDHPPQPCGFGCEAPYVAIETPITPDDSPAWALLDRRTLYSKDFIGPRPRYFPRYIAISGGWTNR